VMSVATLLEQKFILVRSGHASLDNDHRYTVHSSASSLPGVKFYQDGTIHMEKPLSGILSQEQVDFFINKRFDTSIELFMKRSPLYALLLIAYASLLRYSEEDNRDLGLP